VAAIVEADDEQVRAVGRLELARDALPLATTASHNGPQAGERSGGSARVASASWNVRGACRSR
jgi:hypothetical protein